MTQIVTKKAPTIVDVAKRVRLANTTVAEILRGKPGYNEATRQRVLETAKHLGYRPNYLSKALAGSKSKTIGVLAALTETSVVATIVRDIELASRRNDYLCYLVDYGGEEDESQLVAHLQNLLDRRIDALVAYQLGDFPPLVEALLNKCNIPVLRLGIVQPDKTKLSVNINRDTAAHQLAEHLAALGHREAGLIISEYGHHHPDQKITPFREAFAKVGIKLDCSRRWMVEPGTDYDYGCQALLQREIVKGNLPTALVCSSDRFAIEVYAALHDAGLRVPEDLSVVGFDNDYHASMMRPALTTIRQPRSGIGDATFSMLMEMMNDPSAKVANRIFDCKLITRDSTGPA